MELFYLQNLKVIAAWAWSFKKIYIQFHATFLPLAQLKVDSLKVKSVMFSAKMSNKQLMNSTTYKKYKFLQIGTTSEDAYKGRYLIFTVEIVIVKIDNSQSAEARGKPIHFSTRSKSLDNK